MIVGFMVHQWTEAIAATDVQAPQTKAELILTLLWDTICEPLWKMRNSINNSKDSHVEVDDMATMADRLRWYQRNQEKVWITDIGFSAPTQTKIFKRGRELHAELDLKCSTTLASITLLNASRNKLDNPQFTIGSIPIRN